MANGGTIFLKPSESGLAGGLAGQTGADIFIPATGQTFDPVTRTFVGGGAPITDPRQLIDAQIKARAVAVAQAQAQAKRVQEQRRLEELEKKRIFELSIQERNELSKLRKIKQREETSKFPTDIQRRTRTDLTQRDIRPPKRKPLFKPARTSREEFFERKREAGRGTGGRGTIVEREKTEAELSEQALVFRRTFQAGVGSNIKFQSEMERERAKILREISGGGITKAEAKAANIKLDKIFQEKVKVFEAEAEKRGEDIFEKAFQERRPTEFKVRVRVQEVLPELKFEATEVEQRFKEKGGVLGFGGIPSIIAGGGAFAHGFYAGIREEPFKVVKSFAIATAITVGTAGIGSGAVAGATALKVARVGAIGLYATSVGARVIATPDLFGKFETLGRITSTEIAPFGLGSIAGRGAIAGVRGGRGFISSIKQTRASRITPADIKKTPFTSTFPREVSVDALVFKTPARQQLALKKFKLVREAERLDFLRKQPPLFKDQAVLTFTRIPKTTTKTPFAKTFKAEKGLFVKPSGKTIKTLDFFETPKIKGQQIKTKTGQVQILKPLKKVKQEEIVFVVGKQKKITLAEALETRQAKLFRVAQIQGSTFLSATKQLQQQKTGVQFQKLSQQQLSSQLYGQKQRVRQRQRDRQRQRIAQPQASRQRQLQRQLFGQPQALRQLQQQRQLQLQLQAFRQVQAQRIAQPFPSPQKIVQKPLVPFRFPRTPRPSTERPRGQFTTFIRRRGEFRPIGTGLTLGKAFAVGQQRVGRTLAATFKVTGPVGFKPRTPVGFRRKPTKEGILFIERRGLRLSTTPETREIQFAKVVKEGRR